ncbi:MAG: TonB-dependent receptor [Gammaproteobacteria bacterium]|nr:TonB-dependent receptor [Gammaproteobacteria bacterium]
MTLSVVKAESITTTETELMKLKAMSLEALMNVEVTSVSRRKQKLVDAASAVFVINQKDIHHSGATSIPELLRMVPGINVARVDANSWAITSRGLSGLFANKLLVLMDGRSVYSPSFSGVYWSVQDTVLEDIERIEVIRGPGASVWGANAVNGVINIITKSAADTQGTLLTAGTGTEERKFGSIRQGGEIGKGHYRLYAKYFKRDDAVFTNGQDADDAWDSLRAGFRTDFQSSDNDKVTIQGDIYQGDAGETVTSPSISPPYMPTVNNNYDFNGANLLARWERSFFDGSSRALQFYYDKAKYTGQRNEHRQTLDLEYKFHLAPQNSHELVWGVGYRYTWDKLQETEFRSFEPQSRYDSTYNAFIQDEITLIDEKLFLTLGTKLEHNDYSGFEIQPTARLLWHPEQDHSLWLAISRAVRTPNRSEHDTTAIPAVMPPFSGGLPVQMQIMGNDDFDSEVLIAYEAGYRMPFTPLGSIDLALFYNDYDQLRSIESVGIVPHPPSHITATNTIENKLSGESYGVELALKLRPRDGWELQLAYSWSDVHLRLDSDSSDNLSKEDEGTTPEHQLSLRSGMELSSVVDLDLWLRYVDELPSGNIDAYTTLDARLSWEYREGLEFSLVARNLMDSQHAEYNQSILSAPVTEIEREFYGQVTWKY